MTQAIVNVFNADVYEVTLVASHPKNGSSFRKDWEGALTQVKTDHPEDWNMNDIKKLLKKWGWTIFNIRTIEVCC